VIDARRAGDARPEFGVQVVTVLGGEIVGNESVEVLQHDEAVGVWVLVPVLPSGDRRA